MSLVSHIENHLGCIVKGWASSESGDIQVCLFENQPWEGITTLTSLGLSRHVLDMDSGRSVREELVLAFHDRRDPGDLASLLLHIAEGCKSQHRAILRGEVIRLGASAIAGTSARAMYASVPTVFPASLVTFEGSSPPTVFVWLFPIYPREVDFIDRLGWSRFEDLLEKSSPDLFNFERQAVL